MNLDANITSVEFLPRSFITIYGMVWTKYRKSRRISDNTNRYSQSWFWFDDVPEPVFDILTEATKKSNEELVKIKALPTFWPIGLLDSKEEYPFNIKVEQFKIYNPNWDKDILNKATCRITAPSHWPDRVEQSFVEYNLDYDFELEIFKILEEHL